MTIKPELKAEPREATGKGYARKLRAGGRIPAVVYGHQMETMSITVDAKEAEQLFHQISVENTIVELKIAGKKTPLRTLVREIQTHPHRPDFVHIDFYRIQKGVAVEVEIPISLQGTPEGVRQEGGILDQIVYEIRVKCIPSKIPESVEVDVTALEIGDAIRIVDVDLGEGVEILLDPERTICHVVPPRVLEVEAAVEEEIEELEEGEVPEEAPAEEAAEADADAAEEEG